MTNEQYRRAANVIRVEASKRRGRAREVERLLNAAGKWIGLQAMMEMRKTVEEAEAATKELEELADAIEEEAERRLDENEN